MNVNKDKQELFRLHRIYNECLTQKIDEWIASSDTKTTEPEFCATEKNAYIDWMAKKLPVQYENIMRMEEGNF